MSILGIRLANTALFVLGCFLVADIINKAGIPRLVPDGAVTVGRVAPPPVSQPSWQERKKILDRNLFGAQVVAVEVEAEPEPELLEELEKTRLPLKLLGTISSEDQLVASAAVENTQKRLHQILKVGDTLAEYTKVVVSRIDRGRVILQNGAQREELLLDKDNNLAPTIRKSAPRRSSRRRHPARGKPDSAEERLKELANSAGDRSTSKLLSEARILPKFEAGKMVGLEVRQIKADSFYEKIGMQDGDILTSVNGITIDNPTASKQADGHGTHQDRPYSATHPPH